MVWNDVETFREIFSFVPVTFVSRDALINKCPRDELGR